MRSTPKTDLYSDISDADLRRAVHAADDEGLASGERPNQRSFGNVLRVLKRFNIDGVVLAGVGKAPIVSRIEAANNALFRKQDQAGGGIHLGAIMFRDLFARFDVPVIFGAPNIDILELVDLTEYQKGWLASDGSEAERFQDQALDLLDFGYGMSEFGHGRSLPPLAGDLIFRSHIHLEAAAATASGPFDFRGTIQSALLGSELALKAGLAAHGVSEKNLKSDYGHNQTKAANKLGELEADFARDRVARVLATFPDYVASRYGGPQPTRLEVGHVLMGAQYIASEVTRRFSDRDIRKDNGDGRSRAYPQ
jgi:hypothetical protein